MYKIKGELLSFSSFLKVWIHEGKSLFMVHVLRSISNQRCQESKYLLGEDINFFLHHEMKKMQFYRYSFTANSMVKLHIQIQESEVLI